MRKIKQLLACAVLAFSAAASALPVAAERTEWAAFFAQAPAVGTIAILDTRGGEEHVWVHNAARAQQRFSPASTFKIPHTLFALQAGAVRDEFEVIAWDGVQRGYPGWNQNQTLRSAMRYSTVWVFERFAEKIGHPQLAAWMRENGYGNAATTGEAPFWVEGDLAISALEQLVFLQLLYRNALPLDRAHQLLTKDVMVVEAGSDWIVRAKTGWSGSIGWWVGWVERPTGTVFFALNIDTPRRQDDLAKRQSIARQVLRAIQALPVAP